MEEEFSLQEKNITKQIMQQQTLHNDESEAIDKEKSCIPENELDRKFIAVEVRQ